MTGYVCSSKCRHCLYGSSPEWENKFVNEQMAKKVLSKIKSMGCYEIHIGGGEPFLDLNSLLGVLKEANKKGIIFT